MAGMLGIVGGDMRKKKKQKSVVERLELFFVRWGNKKQKEMDIIPQYSKKFYEHGIKEIKNPHSYIA